MKNYDFEHAVTDIELTVINDGDGSQCGYSYDDRCAAALFPGSPNQYVFLNAARNYDHVRQRAGAAPASEAAIQEAARRLTAYYVEHAQECD